LLLIDSFCCVCSCSTMTLGLTFMSTSTMSSKFLFAVGQADFGMELVCILCNCSSMIGT
jgi:hypothetical protein